MHIQEQHGWHCYILNLDGNLLQDLGAAVFIYYLFRNSQFHMQHKINTEDKRVQYEI